MKFYRHMLDRIAFALTFPGDAFVEFLYSSTRDRVRLHECVELVESFQQLQDHEARRRCLRFVQAEVEQLAKAKHRADL